MGQGIWIDKKPQCLKHVFKNASLVTSDLKGKTTRYHFNSSDGQRKIRLVILGLGKDMGNRSPYTFVGISEHWHRSFRERLDSTSTRKKCSSAAQTKVFTADTFGNNNFLKGRSTLMSLVLFIHTSAKINKFSLIHLNLIYFSRWVNLKNC